MRLQPTRPIRKARKYSSTCSVASRLRGSRTSSTRPPSILHPFAMRTMPPVATTTSGSSMIGRATRRRASSSRIASASIAQT